MSVAMEREIAVNADPAVRTPSRDRFFLYLVLAMAATVFIGFAPTYYLRVPLAGFFDIHLKQYFGPPRPLSGLLIAHGIVMSVWYLLLATQAALIATGRAQWHRRLGVAGLVVAAAVAVTAPLGNGPLSIAFVTTVGLAVYFRRHPEAHKRLMLVASIAALMPATGRAGALAAIAIGQPQIWFVLLNVFQALFLAALVLYDLRRRGRLHAVTLWGVPVCLLAGIFLPPR